MPSCSIIPTLFCFPFLIVLATAGRPMPQSTIDELETPIGGLRSKSDDSLFSLQVRTGKDHRPSALVKVLIDAEAVQDSSVELVDVDGNRIPAQVSTPGIEYDVRGSRKLLTFVATDLPPHATVEYVVQPLASGSGPQFEWHDDQIAEAELQFDGQSVVRYMYEALDDASPQRRDETCKTYHHVFSPDGTNLLTKGPGGLYPHHRGIFFGFNRIRYDDRQADTWHCRDGESQTQSHSRSRIGGAVFGRDQNVILWNGRDGLPFATEIRQLACYRIGDTTLIEFHSTLKSQGRDVTLDGDPQHAGVQFRASQQVADKTREKTFYIRLDGIGMPGQFRNWSNKTEETEINRSHRNLKWNAMCFVVNDQTYTCVYLDHPGNPKPAMFSERDYGRFGSYFKYELTADRPLTVRYRYWVHKGTMTVDDIEQLSRDFVDPVAVTIP